jgi:hypothetical protein
VHLSPELAVSMIAALAGLWQVYVAKQVFRQTPVSLGGPQHIKKRLNT